MNPLHISARSYRSFESLDLAIPSGCIAVVGANGAGKSSIVNLIDLCLFGTRTLSSCLSRSAPDSDLEITLDFEHAGETYRVRRSFSGRGRGKTTLDFEIVGMGADPLPSGEAPPSPQYEEWEPLTREDQKATQALIEETIGLSRETFRASAFLAQGDGAAFTEAQPRDRKRILCQVLGLDRWDLFCEQVRGEATRLSRETAKLDAALEQADAELAGKDAVVEQKGQLERDLAEAESDVTAAETAHQGAQKELGTFRETIAKLEAARVVLDTRRRELQAGEQRNGQIMRVLVESVGLPELLAEAEKLAGQERGLEEEKVAALHGVEARKEYAVLVDKAAALQAQAEAADARATAAYAKAEQLDQAEDEQACDRCGQTLGAEARTRACASFVDEGRAADAERATLTEQAESVPLKAARERVDALEGTRSPELIEADLRRARAAREEVASIAERLRQLDALQTERDELLGALSGMSQAVTDAERDVAALEADLPSEDLEANVARANATLLEARGVHAEIRSRLDVAKAELDRLAAVEARSAANRSALAERQRERDLLQLEERIYGRDGIPVFILENTAIPALEVEAQRILNMLGGKTAGARIELRTQRALKSGDGLRESLDIVLYWADGDEQAYEDWSGGEKMRINLALRLALANVLANRRGAESQVFVLDEPGDLDVAGKQALVELLREVQARGIDKVLLVSHDAELRDAFDESIEVELVDEHSSRIVGASEPTAEVAA